MPGSEDLEDRDVYLEEALRRIGNPDEGELSDSFKQFSKIRTKAFGAINSLKDTVSRKQELVNLVEELSILFFQNGVKLGTFEKMDTIVGRLTNLETKIDSLQSGSSYADTVKGDKVSKVQVPSGRAVTPIPKKAILITPINEEGNMQTCEDTKKVLLRKIRPGDLGIRPDRLLKSGKASIRIETKELSEDSINKEALKKAGLKYEVVGKLKPRLAIFGVPSDIEENGIKGEIVNILGEDSSEQITLKSRFGPRDKHFNHWVIEVSPAARKELLQRERIYIGWSACSVKDHVRIIRCYKCQKFGHLQKDCRGTVACGYCAGEHDTRRCRAPGNPPKCYNCTKAGIRENGHEAKSTKCHMYVKKVKDTISNTDYGQ